MRLAECHPTRKFYSLGMCRSCYEKDLRAKNPDFAQRQRENNSKWGLKDDNKQKAQQRYEEKRRTKIKCDPVYAEKVARSSRNSMLKRNYGITQDDFERILKEQNDGCAICGRKGKNRLHVDHCHSTGKVRGILCHQCNWYLGTIDADPNVLERLQEYVRRNKA